MTETKFNKQMAEAWITEVEGELKLVDQLLEEVAEECATQPYEDDTIMNTLVQTGKGLLSAWNELGGIFTDVVKETRSIISEIAKGVSKAVQGITDFANSVKI